MRIKFSVSKSFTKSKRFRCATKSTAKLIKKLKVIINRNERHRCKNDIAKAVAHNELDNITFNPRKVTSRDVI